MQYVRNFTDVDDKIINRAAEAGEDPLALASRFIDEFHAVSVCRRIHTGFVYRVCSVHN